MVDYSKAFETREGFLKSTSGIDGAFFTGSTSSPVGLDLPVNTYYVQTLARGVITWRKYGSSVNDWSIQTANDFYFYDLSTSLDSTNEAIALNKITNTRYYEAGTYTVNCSFQHYESGANSAPEYLIVFNSATIWALTNPVDATKPVSASVNININVAIADSYTLSLQYRQTNAGGARTAWISNAHMEIIRRTIG